jgi:hypothetical protein
MNSLPIPLQSQYYFRDETVTCYASDFRGTIEYRFNALGYRSDIEYDIEESKNKKVFAWLGSSITSAHSIPLDQGFPSIVSKHFKAECWSFSQGCYRVSNKIICEQLEELLKSDAVIDTFFIQFISLNRRGSGMHTYLELDFDDNIKEFEQVFTEVQNLLANKKWYWLLMDQYQHKIPEWIAQTPNMLTLNPVFLDTTGITGHPGPKTHQAIGQLITKRLDYDLQS